MKDQAENYFKSYPTVNTLYATKDGQFFTEKNPCQLHAKTAFGDAQAFETFERDQADEVEVGEITEESTLKEIKAYLTDRQVDFKKSAKKDELLPLALEAQSFENQEAEEETE